MQLANTKPTRRTRPTEILERARVLRHELRERRIVAKHCELRHTRYFLAILNTLFQSLAQIDQSPIVGPVFCVHLGEIEVVSGALLYRSLLHQGPEAAVMFENVRVQLQRLLIILRSMLVVLAPEVSGTKVGVDGRCIGSDADRLLVIPYGAPVALLGVVDGTE